jgi:quercetin dioxygenase-like cupin family protein
MSDAFVIGEASVEAETWSDAVRGEVSFRTLFGEQPTTPEFTAGVADLVPGGWLGHHRHQPGEIYYILDGEGIITIDGEEHVVTAATAIYIPGNSEHGIRNSGDSLLRFFYAFAVGGSFDQIEYRFTAEK